VTGAPPALEPPADAAADGAPADAGADEGAGVLLPPEHAAKAIDAVVRRTASRARDLIGQSLLWVRGASRRGSGPCGR
jgi:hypothetical protein